MADDPSRTERRLHFSMSVVVEHGIRTVGEPMGNFAQDSDHLNTPEQKLWRAVIVSTVEEWIHGPLRKEREAEQFLFANQKDYRTVCYSAGIDPTNLRDRLDKIRSNKGAMLGRSSRN